MLAMSLGATTLATVPAWAQGKKRNVVIGTREITWPARCGGRRGGGAPAAAPGEAAAGGAAGMRRLRAPAHQRHRRLRLWLLLRLRVAHQGAAAPGGGEVVALRLLQTPR